MARKQAAPDGRLKRALVVLGALILCGAAGFRWRLPLARAGADWLARPMELERSDVLFVVGGDPSLLLPYALKLMDEGYGRELWVVSEKISDSQKRFTERFGFRSDQEYQTERALLESRLPTTRYRILKGSVSTWTDILMLKAELDRRPMGSVTVVSWPMHSRRIGFSIERILGPKPPARFYFAYPTTEQVLGAFVDPDKLVAAVALETAKNVAYRIKY